MKKGRMIMSTEETKQDLIGGDQNPPATNETPPPTEDKGIQIEYPENFPEEFRDSPTIQKFVDKETGKINYGNALSSLVHAQKLVGSDKIMIPSKTATEDDWNQVFRKLGNPEKVEDYKIEVEGFNMDDPMSKGFIETAHKIGVLPKQAEAIASYFQEASKEANERSKTEIDTDYQLELDNLKKDWGDKFKNNINLATKAFETIFSPEEQGYYKEKGLLADPAFVRAMNKVGNSMLDDSTFKGNEETDTATTTEHMKQSYRESYAVVMKGDKTNPSYEHHRNNLHALNKKAGQMGISLV